MHASLRLSFAPALAAAALALASLSSCGLPSASAGPPIMQGPPKGCPPGPPAFPPVAIPAVEQWDGTPLGVTTASVLIIQRDAQYPGEYVAYRVELSVPAITRAIAVPDGKMPLFIDSSMLASILIRFPTPPPPPIVPNELLETAWQMTN